MIDFKGVHYPKSVILHAVFFDVRYAVSYRDLEEILAERGVAVDHATLNRRVVKFAPLIADQAQARKRTTATSWRMDETYIKVKGRWSYLYRAVDRDRQTLDFLLSERRDLSAARRFFKRATGPMMGFKAFHSAAATLAGIETAHMIRKGQIPANGTSVFQIFAGLAA